MKEKLITVNVTYARIALLLLAANLLLAGYTISKVQSADTPQPIEVEEEKSACVTCGERGRKNLTFLRS